MPIYEYECEACGHSLDALQKMSDPPLAECPACGKPSLRKRVSAPQFRLKGGGWYETDFKSGKKRNLADGDGGTTASGGDKKAGKSDADKKTTSDTSSGGTKSASSTDA
jgi:putative FmdB family regulatory protein